MKRFLTTSLLVAVFTLGLASVGELYAQELPAFTEGNAYVFDAEAISGKAKDSIKAKNLSRQKNFQVTVYGYKGEGWESIARGYLLESGDSDTLECKKKIKSYRYLALATDCKSEFKYFISKRHNDLYIYFLDADQPSDAMVDKAQVFDLSKTKGSFKDNIKVLSLTQIEEPVSFFIYASDEEKGRYSLLTSLVLKGGLDSDSSDQSYTQGKLNSYRYIKILTSPAKDFTYSLSKSHNDLIIQIK